MKRVILTKIYSDIAIVSPDKKIRRHENPEVRELAGQVVFICSNTARPLVSKGEEVGQIVDVMLVFKPGARAVPLNTKFLHRKRAKVTFNVAKPADRPLFFRSTALTN